MLRYLVYGENEDIFPAPLRQLCELGDKGKLGTTLHRIEGRSSSWDRLCALEEDLIRASHTDCREYDGWLLVAGECMIDDVAGWLECDGWVFVFVPPVYQDEHEVDVLVIEHEDFDGTFCPTVTACVSLGDDSGMRLNRALRDNAILEAALR